MERPTKFQLMRDNRYVAEARVAEQARASLQRLIADAKAGISPVFVVPTMEIDGVKYRELPEWTGNGLRRTCEGCAFDTSPTSCWLDSREGANELARATFGGFCGTRKVIYIRAE